MTIYERYRKSSLDTSSIGLSNGSGQSEYVCTPIGAKIIAWSGEQNGLHFCHISGLGELVFAVDPFAPPGDSVHPVAENLLDFISLVCSCGDASRIAGAYRWSKVYFNSLINRQTSNIKTRSVLRALCNIYHPGVIKDPYAYITKLQSTFDYSKIPLHGSYFKQYPLRPGSSKWKVTFDGGFSDASSKNPETREIPLNRPFLWQEEAWCVPAIYLNENHIIVDSYLEIPSDKVRTFVCKWSKIKNQALSLTDQLNRDLEDPFFIPAQSTLTINNKSFNQKQSFEVIWNPYTDNPWNVRRILDHYHLDRNKGYVIRRDCFIHKRHPNTIRSLEYTLSDDPVSVPGQCFLAPDEGKSITFVHPETNITHTLTVISENQEALDPNFLSNHPCFYTKLHYNLLPPIHQDLFRIADSQPSDPWHGSIQDPNAISITNSASSPEYCAISSLRHSANPNVRWQMIFRKKRRQDIRVRLLP